MGDKVNHKKWGVGVIVGKEGEGDDGIAKERHLPEQS